MGFQKKLGLGVDSFKEVIEQDCYYIDKSKFIEDILNDGAKIKLFCRPRRFGKTLNMSMLRYFFDIENKEENRKLFNGLYIEKSPLIIEQGQYPVIFLTMKEIKSTSFEKMLIDVRSLLGELYNKFEYVRKKLNEKECEYFDSIWKERKETNISRALLNLSEYLNKFYNRKVILLIDEYDIPLITAQEFGYYEEAIHFFKTLYGGVLKTNEYLKMGVLTGIVRVAQAGIFSELNNIENYTILSKRYSEYFGLLENEVEKALQDYGVSYKLNGVKSWYNGYKFGDTEVYNPLSILKFLSIKELEPHWVNTSGNVLIKELLKNSDDDVFKTLSDLFEGKETIIFINQSVALGDTLSSNDLWELLLFSGYLTIQEKLDLNTYFVKIPNKEIMTFFKRLFVDIVFNGMLEITKLKLALQKKNLKEIEKSFENLVLNAMSIYDTDKRFESSYQNLFSGFLYGLEGSYQVISNSESGEGRADLILKPLNKHNPAYILELKRIKNNNPERKLEEGLKQIKEKKYSTILEREGITDITNIALAFDKKKVYFKKE